MKINFLKKVFCLGLASILILTLVACNNKIPTGTFDRNEAYLSNDTHTITKGELYDELLLNSGSTIKDMVNEIAITEQMEAVQKIIDNPEISNEDHLEVIQWLETDAANAVFGTSSLKSLADMNVTLLSIKVLQYVDATYLADRSIDYDQMKTDLDTLTTTFKAANAIVEASDENDPYSIIGYPKAVLARFKVNAAQKLYAKQFLIDDVNDEDSSAFIRDTEVFTFFKNNIAKRYDNVLLIVPFISELEANQALYKSNLKANSRGEWAILPDPRGANRETFISMYPAAATFLERSGFNFNSIDDAGNFVLTMNEYQAYYSAFAITSTNSTILSNTLVAHEFIKLYNYISTEQLSSTFEGTLYTFNDLAFNTSLRTHVYDIPHPDSTNIGDKPYSARVQNFGSHYFLVYKFDDSSSDDDNITNGLTGSDEFFDRIDNEDTDSALTPRAQQFFDEAKERITKNRLTSSYVSTKIAKLINDDYPLEIFEPTLRLFYNHETNEDVRGGNNDHNIAKVGDHYISVDTFFETLNEKFGALIASDLLTNKLLDDTYGSQITEEDHRKFRNDYRTMITSFSNDAYAGNGYPSSIGRTSFILLSLGARTNEEAIRRGFIIPKLQELFYADLEFHYGKDVYDKLADISNDVMDAYISFGTSHLLAFIDFDNDGNPDNPANYFEEQNFTPTEIETFRNKVADLVTAVFIESFNRRGSLTDRIKEIVEEFNNVSRVNNGDLSTPADLLWTDYRSFGLFLKWEDLGEITNTTNLQSSPTYDQAFFERAMEVYGLTNELRGTNGLVSSTTGALPYVDFFDYQAGIATNMDKLQSGFGWHFIASTSVSEPNSAQFSKSNDSSNQFVSELTDSFGDLLSAYNNTNHFTAAQIQIYLEESKNEYGVISLPSSVVTTIDTFFAKVNEMISGTIIRKEISLQFLLEEHGAIFANNENTVFMQKYREIAQRQLHSYNSGDVFYDGAKGMFSRFDEILSGPSLLRKSTVTVEKGTDISNLIDLFSATALSRQGDELTVSVSSNATSTDVGIYTVSFTTTDSHGVTVIRTSYLVVTDEEYSSDVTPPAFENTQVSVLTFSVGTTATRTALLDGLTATDTRSGNVTDLILIDSRAVNFDKVGSYIIVYTAFDLFGNSTTTFRTIEIV